MINWWLSLTVLLAMLPVVCMAGDGARKIGGVFTYYADHNLSVKEAKAAAVENAKLQALAREFGTVMTQSTVQQDIAADGDERGFFMQLSSSEVKGEWLEDLDEPVCEVVEVLPDMLVLSTRISGRARALTNENVEFEAQVLRNGTLPQFADTRFNDGDNLFLSFKAPVNGYVAVYLVDEEPAAYCLLPYKGNADGRFAVEKNRGYVFFSSEDVDKKDRQMSEPDELEVTCSNDFRETNMIYVIFSPNSFTKAIDNDLADSLPRQLEYKKFQQWLGKIRRRDPKMGLKVIKIEISK